MGELSGIWIIVFVLLLIAAFGSKGGSSRGGVYVKPPAKTPKPKVKPAPGAIKGKNR